MERAMVEDRKKHVIVLGSGITGLTAAEKLARWAIDVSVIEKLPHLGGHAVHYTCKATDRCVGCGACLVQQQLQRAQQQPGVSFYTNAGVHEILSGQNHTVTFELEENGQKQQRSLKADAILVATGFKPYKPKEKPFGYGQLANVVTNLELEKMLRRPSDLSRPCDGHPVRRMAFFQCVGSRDASLGHRWCSQVCCGSALRMARLIQHRNPRTEITFFYIDVQSIGKSFQAFDQQCRQAVSMVRAIPGEIYPTTDGDLRIIYFDPLSRQQKEELFDLAVLSVGMLPASDNRLLSETLQLELAETGYYSGDDPDRGIFSAGAARGPMSIADCIGSAERAVSAILNYLDGFVGRRDG